MDEPLQHTPTHSANESEGGAFGLDLSRLVWVVVALPVGLVPGWLLAPRVGFLWAAVILFGPALLVALVQFVLFQNRPPGWFLDWLETRLTGGNLTELPFQRSCLDE